MIDNRMRLRLKELAKERSTYEVPLTFADSSKAPVTPDSVRWSLSTTDGAIINGRSQVVAAPAPALSIVLSGADLAVMPGEVGDVPRLVTIEATYSSTEGSGLPLKDEVEFTLRPLKVVNS